MILKRLVLLFLVSIVVISVFNSMRLKVVSDQAERIEALKQVLDNKHRDTVETIQRLSKS